MKGEHHSLYAAILSPFQCALLIVVSKNAKLSIGNQVLNVIIIETTHKLPPTSARHCHPFSPRVASPMNRTPFESMKPSTLIFTPTSLSSKLHSPTSLLTIPPTPLSSLPSPLHRWRPSPPFSPHTTCVEDASDRGQIRECGTALC